jgi:hypothetical protein
MMGNAAKSEEERRRTKDDESDVMMHEESDNAKIKWLRANQNEHEEAKGLHERKSEK